MSASTYIRLIQLVEKFYLSEEGKKAKEFYDINYNDFEIAVFEVSKSLHPNTIKQYWRALNIFKLGDYNETYQEGKPIQVFCFQKKSVESFLEKNKQFRGNKK